MSAVFYVPAAVALASAILVVVARNVMHALLYLLVLLLAMALMLYSIGAPFVAALEVVIYAGAILVLFVFAVMMLNLGRAEVERERALLAVRHFVPELALGLVLLAVALYALSGESLAGPGAAVGPKAVGLSLYRDYLLGIEIASLLLLAALVAAFHFQLVLHRKERLDDGQRSH